MCINIFLILYFFRVQTRDYCPCPSSFSINTISTVSTVSTVSTDSTVSTNIISTTSTTISDSNPTTFVPAPPSVTAPTSATAGGGVPVYLTDLYAIAAYVVGGILSILSVIIFWVRKTCKPSHHTSHISLVSLSCPSSLPPPLLPPPLLPSPLSSTNPFLAQISPPSSNPFLTSSV